MHTGTRVRRLGRVSGRLLVAVFALGMGAAQASAQQTLSECGVAAQSLFCEDDLAVLTVAGKLTDDQKEAARTLMQSGLERVIRMSAERQRELRTAVDWTAMSAMGEDGDPKAHAARMAKYYQAYAKMLTDLAAVERETLLDVRAILTPAQLESGWEAFERSRRRAMLDQIGAFSGQTPRALVGALKLSGAEATAVEPILLTYDSRVDPIVIKVMTDSVRMNQELAKTGDYRAAGWRTMYSSYQELQVLHVKSAAELRSALGEESRQRLDRLRVGIELPEHATPPSKSEEAKRITQLPTLTDDQKSRLKLITTQADDAMYAQALARLREQDEDVLKGRNTRFGEQYWEMGDTTDDAEGDADKPRISEEAKKLQAKRIEEYKRMAAVTTKMLADLRGVLTAAQIDQLDGVQEDGGNIGASAEASFKARRGGSIPTSQWIADGKPEGESGQEP